MRSRYRKDVRRHVKRAQCPEQELGVIDSFGLQAALLVVWVEEARTVYEKAKGFKHEVLARGYYEHMDLAQDVKSVLVVAKRGGPDRGPVSQQWFEFVPLHIDSKNSVGAINYVMKLFQRTMEPIRATRLNACFSTDELVASKPHAATATVVIRLLHA